MTKSISLFNHKGGISKTTTTYNLGWSLAMQGYKTLIVDLDSQCNLTGLVLGHTIFEEEQIESFYESRKNLTLKPIVEALINGAAPDQFIQAETGQLHHTQQENLFLLPGHLDIAELDSQISVALKIASGIPATRNIPGNLPKMLQEIAKKFDIAYVLYDLSPNVGGLNEVVLMSSNYFLVPTSPDYFCLQAIGSLKKNICKWHREIERFREDNQFNTSNFPIHNHPIFLGTIQQRYRPRNEKPAKSFQKWIDTIRSAVNNDFIPALAKINCVLPKEKIAATLQGTNLEPYDLAHIPDFNSLIAISQQLSKPTFTLTDADLRATGKVFGHAETTMQTSQDHFAEVFKALGERIITLTK